MGLGIVITAVMVQVHYAGICLSLSVWTSVLCLLLLVRISAVEALPYSYVDAQPPVQQNQESQLQLVQVVFRHGDRTPDHEEMELYPADPYVNQTFPPFGLKALTNGGKERTYKIGLFLRKYYKDFLNKTYIPDEIYVRTTDYDRTKMSALGCLAGLYPPTPELVWNPKINWQPIPYHTVPFNDDDLMYYYTCPRFLEARLDHLHSPEFQKTLAPHKDIFEKVSFYAGRNLTTPEDIFYIDNLFQAEANYNLTMPKWAVALMKDIKLMTVIEYSLEFATDELSRVAGGQLLYKMLQDAQKKINGTMTPKRRKMFLYSAHENNVAAILSSCGVFKPHQPNYGSTFILELHKMIPSGEYAFRIIYLKDVTKPLQILPIPNCGEFCEIKKFIELSKNRVTKSFKSICGLKHG